MKNKNHIFNCYQYCNKVYDLMQKLKGVTDGRKYPQIELFKILLLIIFSLMSGLHSFKTISEAVEDGDFDKFFNYTVLPSDDTLVYALEHLDLADLRKAAVDILNKARHNQALKRTLVDGYQVVAIDGTHNFTMTSSRLGKKAHKYEHTDNEGNITHVDYREKAVGASYIGSGLSPLLQIKRIEQGEGEQTASRELLRELNRHYHQYCDLIVVDSLYISAPFINTVLRNNKEVIVRVKQENDLIKDAEGIFKDQKPMCSYSDVTPSDVNPGRGTLYDIDIWDASGFIWSDVDRPLRVVKVKETRKEVKASGEVTEEKVQISYFATTLVGNLDAYTVWKIGHRRWDEENSVFHWIKTHWNFDRRYSHKPEVIEAMYYLYVIAYNLFHLYIHKNLRSFDPRLESKKKFIRRFYKGLVTLEEPVCRPDAKAG